MLHQHGEQTQISSSLSPPLVLSPSLLLSPFLSLRQKSLFPEGGPPPPSSRHWLPDGGLEGFLTTRYIFNVDYICSICGCDAVERIKGVMFGSRSGGTESCW